MTANRNFKVGDWVEVKFRGRVEYNDKGGSETLSVAPWPDHDPHRLVHSIEGEWVKCVDPPVKVGDDITARQARNLPVGSVVLYEPGGGASVKVNDIQWISPGVSYHNATPYEPTWLINTVLKLLHVGNPSS